MATVRITKELLHDVARKIHNTSQTVRAATIAPLSATNDPLFKEALREAGMLKLWEKYAHLRNIVPKTWLKEVDRLDVQVHGYPEYQIPGKFVVPPDTKSLSYSYVEVRISKEEIPPQFWVREDNFMEKLAEHERRFAELQKTVKMLLENSKSLNDAVKKHPDLLLHIPEPYKSRLEEVTVRKASNQNKDDAAKPFVLDDQKKELLASVGVLGALYNS